MVNNPIITNTEAVKLEQVPKALNTVALSMSGAVTFHTIKIMKNGGMCSYTNLKDALSGKKDCSVLSEMLVAVAYAFVRVLQLSVVNVLTNNYKTLCLPHTK